LLDDDQLEDLFGGMAANRHQHNGTIGEYDDEESDDDGNDDWLE